MPTDQNSQQGAAPAASTGAANNDMNPQGAGNTPGAQQTPQPAQATGTGDTKTQGLASQAGQQGEPQGAPDAYDFTSSLPEGGELDEQVAHDFGEVCRGMNLTNEQANTMAAFGYKYAQNIVEAAQNQREAQINAWADETKKALGAGYDKTMNAYGAGLAYVEKTIPNIREVLNETGAGNRVEVVQAMALLGKLVSEDPGLGGNAAGGNPKSSRYPNSNMNF